MVKTYFLYFFLIIYLNTSFSRTYGLDSKVNDNPEIKRFKICAERCSGSNFLEKLIKDNFETIECSDAFGHKHFPPWLQYPNHPYNDFVNFENSDDVLFILIVRNPYDWLRSFHCSPHLASMCLATYTFPQFIRSNWEIDEKNFLVKLLRKHDPLADMDPQTGTWFQNPMKLRTAKIQAMLEIKNKVKNFYVIQYETLNSYPMFVINELVSIFNLKKSEWFKKTSYYKGKNRITYKPKKYVKISQRDLDYINAELDPVLEEKVGYNLIKNAKDVQ